MSDKIKLVLAGPDRVVEKGEYWGVVLPTAQNNLTVIAGRAPSLICLKAGVVKLMNSADDMAKKLYIAEGVAEIADDVCTVSSEYVLTAPEANIETVKSKLDSATRLREKVFYQEVYDDLIAFSKN